ncbi:MAG: T9SS type A sorting domain-containing protein, partial [Bacteroidia bacterium]
VTKDIPSQHSSIYPNPSTGKFIFNYNKSSSINKEYEFKVLNILGEPVEINSKGTLQKMELDLSGQPTGIYFFQLKTADDTFIQRIIKE